MPRKPKEASLDGQAVEKTVISVTAEGIDLLRRTHAAYIESLDAVATKPVNRTSFPLAGVMRHGLALASWELAVVTALRSSTMSEAKLYDLVAAAATKAADEARKADDDSLQQLMVNSEVSLFRQLTEQSPVTRMLAKLGDALGVKIPSPEQWEVYQSAGGSKRSDEQVLADAEQRVLSRLSDLGISGKKREVTAFFKEADRLALAFSEWRYTKFRPATTATKEEKALALVDNDAYVASLVDNHFVDYCKVRVEPLTTKQVAILKHALAVLLKRKIDGRSAEERRANLTAHVDETVKFLEKRWFSAE